MGCKRFTQRSTSIRSCLVCAETSEYPRGGLGYTLTLDDTHGRIYNSIIAWRTRIASYLIKLSGAFNRTLQAWHLPQVHELLERTFWDGIDVSDSLEYRPERCTVVATYRRLVLGLVIISSPTETYIMYLAVKAGWENSQIATSLLYHLFQLNLSLYVSAILLYNQFGFKAEEFVIGFFSSQSHASRNAFLLRLRHNL
ncbi:hypothetical protein CPB85DRAFT_596610 [Mucidula mucida]|nr:hypothetical protein CPB85DRAFT_596610 [Mucidula mucida]